jgi:arylsulfatase A-like enzyme
MSAFYKVFKLVVLSSFILTVTTTVINLKILNDDSTIGEKQNILFIGVDDLRPLLNSYGNNQMHTPNLDKLASEGVQFNNAYVNIAVCGASRASILTGIRGSLNRFYHYYSKAETDAPNVTTLPQILKKNGYRTASFGKISHHADDNRDDWDDFGNFREQSDYQNEESLIKQKNSTKIVPHSGKNAGPAFEYADVSDDSYNDGKLTDAAINQLKKYKNSKQPFFLAVGYVSPHLPFIQPTKYGDLYKKSDLVFSNQRTPPVNAPLRSIAHDWTELRNGYTDIPSKGPVSVQMEEDLIKSYYASVSYTDAMVGKLINALETLGLRENTTIVFWSDHGFFLGEHGMWCKHHTFQEAIHVPLIISSPRMKKNIKTNSMVEYIDLYPTLCDIVGIEVPKYLHGKSFKKILENPKYETKSEIYSRYQTLEVVQDKKYSYHEVLNKDGSVRYNMLFDMVNDKKQFYNISTNPENKSIVKIYSKKLKEMRDFSNRPIIVK